MTSNGGQDQNPRKYRKKPIFGQNGTRNLEVKAPALYHRAKKYKPRIDDDRLDVIAVVRFRVGQRPRLEVPRLEAEVLGSRVEEVACCGGLQAVAAVLVTFEAVKAG